MAAESKKNQEALKEAINKGRSRPMLYQQSAADNADAKNLAYLRAIKK